MASRYRKIDPRIWTDEKFRKLKPDEQRIALYVLTAQTNRIGLFSFSPGKACEDLGTLPQTFQKGFLKVCQTLKWEWDCEARVLFLPTWWRYNQPENSNNMIGNLKDLDDLPETPLLERFLMNTAYLSESLRETFSQTFSKRYPQRSPERSPSQEQEQEQEQEKRAGSTSSSPASDSAVKRQVQLSDEEFLEALRKNEAYKHLDLDREFGKMDAWLLTPKGRGRTKTRKFVVSWLNKAADEQRLMTTGPAPSTAGHCQDRQSNGRHSKPCTNPCVHGEAYCSDHLPVRQRIAAHLANGNAS